MSDPTSFVLAYSSELRQTDFRSRENHKWLMQLHRVQQGRCFYCRMWISLRLRDSLDPNSATVDHFIPLALGGRDTIANVVLACPRCNTKKGDNPPTLKEILKWNALSKLWSHIQPLTLDRHVREKKRCVACPNFIPMERWLESLNSDTETRTCSKACSSLERRTRKKQYKAARAAAAAIDLDNGVASAAEADVHKVTVRATDEPGRAEVRTPMSRCQVPDDYALDICEAEAISRLEASTLAATCSSTSHDMNAGRSWSCS